MFNYYFSYFLDTFPKWSVLQYIGFFALCIVLYLVLFFASKKREWDLQKVTSAFVLVLYMLYVFHAAFLSREVSEHFKNYLLRPFWSYRLPMKFIRQQIVREIIANVLIFIPIGFLAPFTVTKKKLLCGLCTGFFFSFLIEILQLLTHKGFSEFDDLFHNTIGTLLGCGAYFLLQLFIRIIQRKKNKEKI